MLNRLRNRIPVSDKVLIAIIGLVATLGPTVVTELQDAGLSTPTWLGGLFALAAALGAYLKREKHPAPSAVEAIGEHYKFKG